MLQLYRVFKRTTAFTLFFRKGRIRNEFNEAIYVFCKTLQMEDILDSYSRDC